MQHMCTTHTHTTATALNIQFILCMLHMYATYCTYIFSDDQSWSHSNLYSLLQASVLNFGSRWQHLQQLGPGALLWESLVNQWRGISLTVVLGWSGWRNGLEGTNPPTSYRGKPSWLLMTKWTFWRALVLIPTLLPKLWCHLALLELQGLGRTTAKSN